MRARKCKHCKTWTKNFIAIRAGAFCDIDCAQKFASKKAIEDKEKIRKKFEAERRRQIKEADREHRERKKSIRKKAWYIDKLRTEFNRYIRLRDYFNPCISCGRHHEGQYHAGHYKTAGGHPELRFEELNVHKQCAPCNNKKSGDIVNYRANLIKKIGIEKVEWIEGPHERKHYTIDEMITMTNSYKEECKIRQKEIDATLDYATMISNR